MATTTETAVAKPQSGGDLRSFFAILEACDWLDEQGANRE